MAFQLIFLDSFDHYATGNLAMKWTAPGTQSNIQASSARTGTQCLELSGPNGPQKAIGVQTNVIAGHAYLAPSLSGRIFIFYNTGTGDEIIGSEINGDGSISMYSTNSHITIGTTAPGLVSIGAYVYLEYAIAWTPTTTTIWLRVNGLAIAPFNPFVGGVGPAQHCDLVVLSGVGAGGGSIHDDVYMGISTTPNTIQNDFLGPVRIYPYIPAENKTPLQWTPLAGTNFSEVNQVPPPGDTAYVADGTVGDIDQYRMAAISGQGPTGSFTIPCGQTVLCAKLDAAGSRIIAPDIGGHVGNDHALGSDYLMYTDPYLINPVTGVPFVQGDFNTTFFGQKVTG